MLPLFWKALDFNMWISDFEDQQLHSGIQNLWAWIIPLKHSEMTTKYLFWTHQKELTVINCVLLQLISQLWFLSRNSQYETIYQSVNITNKMALKDILWLPKTECILLKISLFFLAVIHDLLLLTKLAAIPVWSIPDDPAQQNYCFRAFRGFISKLIFSSNTLTIHLT